jgi:hypothetical protein
VTPGVNTTITFPTITDWATKCGLSRQWAGVHFAKSVRDARKLCPKVGRKGYKTALKYLNGKITKKMQPVPKPPPGGINLGNIAGYTKH